MRECLEIERKTAVTRPPVEVADLVRQHGDRFLESHRASVIGHETGSAQPVSCCLEPQLPRQPQGPRLEDVQRLSQ
jgi:hypothetical protein